MIKYSLKRLAQSLVTLMIVVSAVFMLMRLLPIEGYFGDSYDKLTESQREAILDKMGLLDPWYEQLGNFYAGLLKGDLGTSTIYRKDVPVLEVIAPRVPYSVRFGVVATVMSIVLGLAMGIHMTRYKGRFWDKTWTAYIVFVSSVPSAVYLLFVQLYGTSLFKVPLLFDKYRPSSWILPVISMAVVGIAG